MAPKGPYKLCTVNTVPARAKLLIGRVVEDVKEDYTIHYLANAERKWSSLGVLSIPFRNGGQQRKFGRSIMRWMTNLADKSCCRNRRRESHVPKRATRRLGMI